MGPIDSSCLEDLLIDRYIYTHTNINNNYVSILFNPLINKGIVKIEILNVENLIGYINNILLFYNK